MGKTIGIIIILTLLVQGRKAQDEVGQDLVDGETDSVRLVTEDRGGDEGDGVSSERLFGPVQSPFLFMCHYPRQGEPSTISRSDVTVQFHFPGNLSLGYEPRKVYEVGVSSNALFDGFLMTGVQVLSRQYEEANNMQLPAALHGGSSGGMVCAVLHSHIAARPRSSINFLWMSPPPGSGCISFLATATLEGQIIFKDMNLFRICEEGEEELDKLQLPESLVTGKDQKGYVMRDDFEDRRLSSSIWGPSEGVDVSARAAPIMYGAGAHFQGLEASLQTVPLNLSRAKNLRFVLGSGDCSHLNSEVRVSYGTVSETLPPVSEDPIEDEMSDGGSDKGGEEREEMGSFDYDTSRSQEVARLQRNDCRDWQEVHRFSIAKESEVHLQPVPPEYRKDGVCIRWSSVDGPRDDTEDTEFLLSDPNVTTSAVDPGGAASSESCWGLDDVAVLAGLTSSDSIAQDFDPIDPSEWLFFPGAQVKEWCGSEGNSLVFSESNALERWASTRLVDAYVAFDTADSMFSLDPSHLEEWELQGGEKAWCGQQSKKKRLVMDGAGVRKVCTPFIDTRNAGALELEIGLCAFSRDAAGVLMETVVSLQVEIDGQREDIQTMRLNAIEPIPFVYTLGSRLQHEKLRFCVMENKEREEDEGIWFLESLEVLPWSPMEPKVFFQAQVNLECGDGGAATVEVEFSTDGGLSWLPMHRHCLPENCKGPYSAITSMIEAQTTDRWGLVTIPFPYAAMTPQTRLRMRQVNGGTNTAWAVDNVFVGRCPQGCNGRGFCQPEGHCKCEYGFSGAGCELPERENPVYVSEPFTGLVNNSANILKVEGGEGGYQCGVLGQGRAAVFLGEGYRGITTVDINTTDAHFLQFHFVAGMPSDVGNCPGPDQASESIYVHYSCNGGVTWTLLHTLHAFHHKSPGHVSRDLPPAAKNIACRFQIWQAHHSGAGKDMWALDDLTVTSQMYNNVQLDFSDDSIVNSSLRFHLGKIGESCGHDSALLFSGMSSTSGARFMETRSMGVGPSFMIQFELVMGCGQTYAYGLNNTLLLEYSLNHGITWGLVERPCTPATPGCKSSFSRGTIYSEPEFDSWKRVTLRLPRHTWSPTTRLRLRQNEHSDLGDIWAIDNLYIGHQCQDMCSGHGRCTTKGCKCDDEFHGHKCLPLDKLHGQVEANFDLRDDIERYNFHVTGGKLVEANNEGCGIITSKKSLYFGEPGLRQVETDDLFARDLDVVQFMVAVGSGVSVDCQPGSEREDATGSFGSLALEYSVDGGSSWELIQELLPHQYRTPKLYWTKLPKEAVTGVLGVVRFRIWQPIHEELDQWAIDDLRITPLFESFSLQADTDPNALTASPWQSITSNDHRVYCSEDDPDDLGTEAQVLNGREKLRMAVTNPLTLNEGDIISFQISVGCEARRNKHLNLDKTQPVELQYSKDGGVSWTLVEKGCGVNSLRCLSPVEPSVYFPHRHGPWSRILLPVNHRLALAPVQLRWVQRNPKETEGGEFAIRGVYVGPPCAHHCHGHGTCTTTRSCKCDSGFNGTFCGIFETPNPGLVMDHFDKTKPSSLWQRTDGASIANGCHDLEDLTLLFSGPGPRFAITRELDTLHIKFLAYKLQIGSNGRRGRCAVGKAPLDNVFLQYSTDNGQTWTTLQYYEPGQTLNRNHTFFTPLPDAARTSHTRFRWWQTYADMDLGVGDESESRAEWHLDDVMLMATEFLPLGFHDDFEDVFPNSPKTTSHWFQSVGAQQGNNSCSKSRAMLMEGRASQKLLESWDVDVTDASVLQFDITVGGCSKEPTKMEGRILLEYSTDHGRNWNLARLLCSPPKISCMSYHEESVFSTQAFQDWTRVTLPLPIDTVGERTRLRWIEEDHGDSLPLAWGIDNVYIGNSCPWTCSGHGYCKDNECICDEGYFGDFCVPESVLPCELLDTFDTSPVDSTKWLQVLGGEVSHRCGVLVSKTALVFHQDGTRKATTIDMDMTAAGFIQFYIKFGCDGSGLGRGSGHSKRSDDDAVFMEFEDAEEEAFSRHHGVLVQYSPNGGISWTLLKELHYDSSHSSPRFVSIELDDVPFAKTNATRFRWWQPEHGGAEMHSWALDDVYIGGIPITPNVLYDDFNAGTPSEDGWIDMPAGEVGHLCLEQDEHRGIIVGKEDEEGERAVYTRDVEVDQMSVAQFDIKVGCGDTTMKEHNVSFEYSTDRGVTWRTLITPSESHRPTSPDCLHDITTPTVYYPNALKDWTRVTIPLDHVHLCGTVRFRWWQGRYEAREEGVPWGIDNVYIGPACPRHCLGHGYCINGDSCICDENYDEEFCTFVTSNPKVLKDGFEGAADDESFLRASGAEVSKYCGVLTGDALVFNREGERMLVTRDLNLEFGGYVQFYLRMSCGKSPLETHPPIVLLQYSTDGGISWVLLEELGIHSGTPGGRPYTRHITIELPDATLSNATRLRWWEPSDDGTFSSQWAIDEVYISSKVLGLPAFSDSGSGANYLLRPGSTTSTLCDSADLPAVHFSSSDGLRFAETPDVVLSDQSFVQITLAMGCTSPQQCFVVHVEYSTDHGASWKLMTPSCLPEDLECTNHHAGMTLVSDLYLKPTLITLPFPRKARSSVARVRVVQPDGYLTQNTWSLGKVYVGDECYSSCSARGFCDAGICTCDPNWVGDACEVPKNPLPTHVQDDFEGTDLAEGMWLKVAGAEIGKQCGILASGSALHFHGGCSRYLETVDMDLRELLFVQFEIKTGCLHSVEGPSGNHGVLLQASCDAGVSWITLRTLPLAFPETRYVWTKLPKSVQCLGGRIRWWQADGGGQGLYDWALDAVIVGGAMTPPNSLQYTEPPHLTHPLWLRTYNTHLESYCEAKDPMPVMMSTAEEAAILQTTDLFIHINHSVHFTLALGCGSEWDAEVEPVRLEYSEDFGHTWDLVRRLCVPGMNSPFCSGTKLHEASVFYAPQEWRRFVFSLDHIAPAKYVRFRWIQEPSLDLSGAHRWSLRDVYIGASCYKNCYGRGICLDGECHCDPQYAGDYCQILLTPNVPYIKDTFGGSEKFADHWDHHEGALVSRGCGGLEEPPTAMLQGRHTRTLVTRPVDTRSARFVLFTAQIGGNRATRNRKERGSSKSPEVCGQPSGRADNAFLQYSINGGIDWELLRELDFRLYSSPHSEYIVMPLHARTLATIFRWWQPGGSSSPAWALDDVFIGGNEIGAAYLSDQLDGEPTISEWLFAPHSKIGVDFCEVGSNSSLLWDDDSPGHRAITTQELIIHDGHVLQFKISVGCGKASSCEEAADVRLEYSRDGGTSGWDLVLDNCLPGSSPDPDCLPYTFHAPSLYAPDTFAHWTRVTIPLPEKTWASTTQFRWIQAIAGETGTRVTPWALRDVYVGRPCPSHCNGHGDCKKGICICDKGYHGVSCQPQPHFSTPLPTNLIDGFEVSTVVNWATVSGGGIGLGCSSLAPYGHGKHLYFNGCGTRQAVTVELDTRRASKLMFVLRIGSHDNTPSCRIDLRDPQRVPDKGVVLQFTPDNGVTWTTISLHDPLDFKKARRVAYSLPPEAREVGVRLRWWQPDHDGLGIDQWALDNVEIVLAHRKDTSNFEQQTYHDSEL
ncbi:reelin-like isoform X2 [Oratosquilla oratoria]|uniref:reelin-like isoform X2 n=1 Tax=Oratosquilla oratoria TaxID=337810 RepID=UPI003F77536F